MAPPSVSVEPWLRTIKRELRVTWPFMVGFAVTGALFTSIALSVTEDDVKKSKYRNPGAH
eukprot:CAMPEP_0197501642 /NCGR_PEP_ID=MMETSP1312-20131121/870_1 /TAXON_ID=464262 /ORGANISM="Genus nov. species nov., Strain RCC2335" /LENGTH=59 /DNA_ID=CAMNT_0043047625 /DNA_START=39 /DNA_END=218 /DNA_ORIENTATION=-